MQFFQPSSALAITEFCRTFSGLTHYEDSMKDVIMEFAGYDDVVFIYL